MTAGQVIEDRPFETITRERLKAYAEASRDHNPIHLDDEAARAAGLPGIIAHGMLIAAFAVERALRFKAEQKELSKFRLSEFQARFRAMTLLGDTISVGGSVKEVTPSRVAIELRARNQRGELTTTAAVVFQLAGPERP